MEIKVGDEWAQGEIKMVEGHPVIANLRMVRVLAIETCFVCVEEIHLPKHPEYGHPRRWMERGMFVSNSLTPGSR